MAFCKNVNTKKECTVDILPTSKRCRYHKKRISLSYSKLAPDGLCLEAFHSIFPLAFAMFSTPPSKLADNSLVICPAGEVTFRVYRRPFLQLRYLPGQIMRRIAGLFFVCEVLRYRCFIEVEKVKKCPYMYSAGERFEVNIGNTSDLCPAASNNFFPYLVPELYGEHLGSNDVPLIACPDHKTDVHATLAGYKDVSERSNDRRICRKPSDVSIEIVKGCKGFEKILKDGCQFKLVDLLDEVGLPCLSYLNTAGIYFRVLREGGRLGFYTNDYNTVLIQCPSTGFKVVTRIEHNPGHGVTSFTVCSSKGRCPLNMSKGKTYKVDSNSKSSFWFHALACLAPYLLNPEMTDKFEVYFSLPKETNNIATFRIHTKQT